MKTDCINRIGIAASVALSVMPHGVRAEALQTSWSRYRMEAPAQRTLAFDIFAAGKKTPILWGFDTAWNDYGNMLRGVRHCGVDVVSCARVSFQPWAEITEKGVLPQLLKENLDKRMATVGLIGKKVDIVLNLDGGTPTIKEIYGGWDYENPDDPWHSEKTYIGDVVEQGPKWADLIDATAAAVEAKGYKVITASPLNEPDLEVNGTPIELFYQIAKNLKDYDKYPRFRDIRISGGNTLNDDVALEWYEYNKEFLDEGNTHQLAGNFDNYASFFTKVREDGKHATADELHNVMEAIVGVEYGMQTGIWWGSAEQCRGEFMKASFGDRLAYAENRDAWSVGAVYRAPSGKIQGFLGCSERQAKPSTYRFVSLNGDVFMDGFGPAREFTVEIPGDPNGVYQSANQRSAETVIAIENGEDVRPYVNGEYALINAADYMAASLEGASTADGTYIVAETYTGADHQVWSVTPVPNDNGGDFSYYFIRTKGGKSMDDYEWNIEVGAPVRLYGHSGISVQQWALEYAGDNWFRIRGRNSGLYLEYETSAAGSHLVQKERSETPAQKWRLLSVGVPLEFEEPDAPTGVTTISQSASVRLEWQPVSDAGEITYAVLRAEKGSGRYITIARDLTGTSFLDNSVEEEEYSYKIFAMDASGNRSTSSVAVDGAVNGVKGLIAHFPLANDVEDATENGFDLKTYCAPVFSSGSLSMSGQQYAQLPYSVLESDSFTVMMKVACTTFFTDRLLFSTGIGSQEHLSLNIGAEGASALTAVKDGKSDEIRGPEVNDKSAAHVAVVVDDDAATLYINGEAVGPPALQGMIPDVRLLTYICRGQESTGAYYTGSVSNLRVYNRALDASEIADIISEESGVEGMEAVPGEVVCEEYYSTQGAQLTEPLERGITVVHTSYNNGSVRTHKIVR